ncbi:hypothetical protein FQR65_LT19522 [Abscondita terminalis]|nr:hypothetical protein FQR65_LT19522 [Abscondita terminalis]
MEMLFEPLQQQGGHSSFHPVNKTEVEFYEYLNSIMVIVFTRCKKTSEPCMAYQAMLKKKVDPFALSAHHGNAGAGFLLLAGNGNVCSFMAREAPTRQLD